MIDRNVDWSDALDRIGPDPLHVLRSTAAVTRSARAIVIAPGAIDALADRLLTQHVSPEWDASLHNPSWIARDDIESLTTWILLIDALNFCFWGQQGPDPGVRWRVEPPDVAGDDEGPLLDGYVALIAALDRGGREEWPLLDPDWLATVEPAHVAALFRPAPGHADIPLFDTRVRNMRELGRGLNAQDSDTPATGLLKTANGSAMTLIRTVVHLFPSFDDVATWPRAGTGLPNHEVRFYKRAQILVGDLSGALRATSLGRFHDLDQLTAFADYKVPQVLHWLGILRYSPELTSDIDRLLRIPAGSEPEIEVRAATIWAIELLRQALANRGRAISAHELDWLLWEQGQSLPKRALPYHRTPTVFY